MTFKAFRQNGTEVVKGDKLHSRGDQEWTFQSVTHPRKVFVTHKNDPNGDNSWPNRQSQEFYASVFDLGIWDTDLEKWSFAPNWSVDHEEWDTDPEK